MLKRGQREWVANGRKRRYVLHDAQEEAVPSQWAAVVYEPKANEQPFVDECHKNRPGCHVHLSPRDSNLHMSCR
jgi:hypothetical protein